MEITNIVIVDDENLFRELLCRTLSNERGLKIVGQAEDGESAIRITEEIKPDVVLMDIELPGKMNGIEAALQIKKKRPDTGIVILSAHSDRRYMTSLPIDNFSGWAYLLKQTVPDIATVVRAIYGSKNGMVVMDPHIVNQIQPKRSSKWANMTSRQQEVLKLIAQGYNNVAIANILKLSEKSVETYINVIYQELGLSHEPGINSRVMATIHYLQSC
jgi:DNA-binding NarL/FixJ family response regulator